MSEDSSSSESDTSEDVFTGKENTKEETKEEKEQPSPSKTGSSEVDFQALKDLKKEILQTMDENSDDDKEIEKEKKEKKEKEEKKEREKEEKKEKEKEEKKEKEKVKETKKKDLSSSSSAIQSPNKDLPSLPQKKNRTTQSEIKSNPNPNPSPSSSPPPSPLPPLPPTQSSPPTTSSSKDENSISPKPTSPMLPRGTIANDNRASKRVNTSDNIKRIPNLNIKEGFLIKRGGRVKNWKTRWFVLKPDGYYYFENPKEWRPLSIVPIMEITSIDELSETEQEILKIPENIKYFFFFKIISSKRDYVCAATSNEEREDWITLGRNTLEVARGKSPNDSN